MKLKQIFYQQWMRQMHLPHQCNRLYTEQKNICFHIDGGATGRCQDPVVQSTAVIPLLCSQTSTQYTHT
jgi:hypothetical protein